MEKNQNLIFGINSVIEKLKAASQEVVEIFVSDRAPLRAVREEAQRLGVRVVPADPHLLEKLAKGQRHQGVVARIEEYRYFSFEEMIERIAPPSVSERILILDGLTDPRNFGALLRTADGAGVNYVIIPKDRSVGVTPLISKASAGALHHIHVVKVTNLRRAIADLKRHGYWVVGLAAKSLETIYDRNFPARLAIVLGSEGAGIRPINLRECDFTVSIPMLGKVDSLNVSVAGAVFLYELLRQSLRS
jgi:23S rRNA (guanosine2251-2'-O)-methyltransferase